MTWIARGLGALIVLAVAGLAAFELFLDDAFYRWAGLRAVREATGWSVVAGDVSASHGRVLTIVAHDVKAESRAREKPRRTASIGEFQLEIQLWPLLRGVVHVEDALVRDADFELGLLDVTPGDRPPPSPAGLPIVEQARLQDVRIRFATPADSHHLQLDELVLEEASDGGIGVRGAGLLDGRRASLEGSLGTVDVLLAESQPYPVELSLDAPLLGLKAKLAGTIDRPLRGVGMNVGVDLSVEDLATMRDTLGIRTPVAGSLALSTRLKGAVNSPGLEALDVRIEDGERLRARARGAVQRPAAIGGVSLRVDLSSNDPAHLRSLGFPELPADVRTVDAHASIEGDVGAFRVRKLEVRARGGDTFDLQVEGGGELRALDAAWPIGKLDLSAKLTAPGVAALGPWLPAGLPDAGAVHASGAVSLDGGAVDLKDVAVDLGEASTLGFRAVGKLTVALPEKAGDAMPWQHPPLTAGLALAAQVADLAAASPLVNRTLPDLGALTVSSSVDVEKGNVTLRDIKIALGGKRPLQVGARGTIELPGAFGKGSPAVKADLAVKASGPDGAALAPLGVEPGLPIAAWTAEGSLRGGLEKAALEDLRVTIGEGDAAVTFEGTLDGVQRVAEGGVQALRFDARVSAASTAALVSLFGRPVPAIGPLTGEMALRGTGDGWSLTASSFRAKDEAGVEVEARASAVRLPSDLDGPLDGLEVGVQVRAPTSAALGKHLGVALPPAGAVTLAGKASGEGRVVKVHDLRLAAGEADALVLSGEGRVDPFADPPSYALSIKGAAKNLAALAGKADDPAVPHPVPVEVAGDLDGTRGDARFKGTAGFGETRFDVDAALRSAAPRPYYSVRLHTALARMDDLGLKGEALVHLLSGGVERQPHEAPEDKTAAPPEPPPPGAPVRRVFSDAPLPFDALRVADADVDLVADRVVGERIRVEDFHLAAKLDDGRLRVDPFKLVFEGGSIDLSLDADASADPPRSSLRGDIVDMSIGALHAQMTSAKSVMEGSLNVAARVHGEGRSPREIAASLDGQTDIALEKAKLPGRELDLLLVDTLSWLLTAAISDDKTDVNCAIARFELNDGVATAKALVVDTPDLIAGGAGVIDLRTEQVDLRFQPRSKTLSIGTNPTVHVHGPLAKPGFDTTGAAVGLAGQALTLVNPIAFLSTRGLGLLGAAVKEDADSPCIVAADAATDGKPAPPAETPAPAESERGAAPAPANEAQPAAPPAEKPKENGGLLRGLLPF